VLKKLDILLIKAFLGPFIATFFITAFVLVLQIMWLYIDDFVGKGLDVWTILRWLLYVSATVVPLALPLAVLLSSIMTLGNLGETYELVAIKSAGISLLRFLRPLFMVTVVITLVAFFFNNNIYPIANLKMNTLKYDILVSKPAFDIKEGVFFDKIEGFVIKIGKKEKDDSTIRNVVIYEQNSSGGNQDNMIIADSGTMVVSPDKRNLIFTLKDGWRYQERGNHYGTGTELIRLGFRRYKKVMDLSSFMLNQTNDSAFRNNYQMLNIIQLNRSIDSIRKVDQTLVKQSGTAVSTTLKFPAWLDTTGWAAVEKKPGSRYLLNADKARDSLRKIWVVARKTYDSAVRVRDSVRKAQKAIAKTTGSKPSNPSGPASSTTSRPASSTTSGPASSTTPGPTSSPTAGPGAKPPGQGPASSPGHPTTPPTVNAGSIILPPQPSKDPPDPVFTDVLPDSVRMRVVENSLSTVNSAKVGIFQPVALYNAEEHNIVQREMAWHEKLTMAVACLVMFLVGAPLGSIIRKGGIGMPLVIAVVFFLIFFLLNNFGKKLAGQSVLSPVGGEWMATYVLTPIGIFLIYKALHDSQLFNKEFYFRLGRKIRPLLPRWKKTRKISSSSAGS
jgi:lipopolysaccharide export system permease protein